MRTEGGTVTSTQTAHRTGLAFIKASSALSSLRLRCGECLDDGSGVLADTPPRPRVVDVQGCAAEAFIVVANDGDHPHAWTGGLTLARYEHTTPGEERRGGASMPPGIRRRSRPETAGGSRKHQLAG